MTHPLYGRDRGTSLWNTEPCPRTGTAAKAALAVRGRYRSLSTRWLPPASVAIEAGHALPRATPTGEKQRGQPKANAATSTKRSTVAKKLAARVPGNTVGGRADGSKHPDAASFAIGVVLSNPYAMSRDQVFEVLRKTNMLTPAGQLTEVFR